MFVVDRLIVCVGEGMILNYSKFTHVHTHSPPATAASECVSAVQLDNIALGVVDVTVDAPGNNNCRQPTHELTNSRTNARGIVQKLGPLTFTRWCLCLAWGLGYLISNSKLVPGTMIGSDRGTWAAPEINWNWDSSRAV